MRRIADDRDVIDAEWRDVTPAPAASARAARGRRRSKAPAPVRPAWKRVPRQVVEIAVCYGAVIVLAALTGPPGVLLDPATHAVGLGMGAVVAVHAWMPGA